MNTTTLRRGLLLPAAAVAGAAALVLAGALPASAHVTAAATSNAAGAYTVVTFSVPHGCDGSATTSVAIEIPEGINAVTPTRNALYDVEKVTEDLAEPITDSHGNEVTTRVAQVVYITTDPLPDGFRDAFELSLQLPEEAAGTTLYFPTVQTCEEGESAWIEIPAAGQDPHDLALPAPALDVVASAGDSHGGDAEASTSADAQDGHGDQGAAAEDAAEDGDAGGSNALSITGLVAGLAALVVAGVALARGRAKKA